MKRAFSQLRARAASGDRWAIHRLQWHVTRRLDKGWRPDTVARRLGLSLLDISRLRANDNRPRLVRRASTDGS